MAALSALDAALTASRGRHHTPWQLQQRAKTASRAALVPCIFLEHIRPLTLPHAVLAALGGGAALSLQAGVATVTQLYIGAVQSGDTDMYITASRAAEQHVCAVATSLRLAGRNDLGGGAQAAAALLAPPALLALLEAAVPPLLWAELDMDRRGGGGALATHPEGALLACSSLQLLVGAHCGTSLASPGSRALAARPALQRDLARLLACQLRGVATLLGGAARRHRHVPRRRHQRAASAGAGQLRGQRRPPPAVGPLVGVPGGGGGGGPLPGRGAAGRHGPRAPHRRASGRGGLGADAGGSVRHAPGRCQRQGGRGPACLQPWWSRWGR
jgi:hypothetical protein